ncbi:MAG: hypothetical protein IJA34_04685 [Lachnospiraceae bacterium]|nr:hypothetical protein [Lachnospiraceae bacterium]
MERIIKVMETKYMEKTLDFVEDVFTKWSDNEEGRLVRALVKELEEGSLQKISGTVEYDCYEALH